jgi:hypothetical protein
VTQHGTADADALRIEDIHAGWLAACDEAEWALDAWRASPGQSAYAVYRAAADRADAAQDELADAIRAARRTAERRNETVRAPR